MPQKPKWRNDRSDETARVVKEKVKERDTLEAHLARVLETCLKKGRLYYSGESIDLDGSKDLKAITAEFVGAVARHLYTRFDIADKHFDEKNIPNYLDPGRKNLDQLDPELGLFDAQGHLIRSAPLVETVFEELRRREDENEELEGKALSEHFQKIPFGWPDALLRLVLAAMFRGGAIHLEPPGSDQRVYDITDPRVEGVFTKPQKFKKTRFYPTVGSLTPAEVKEAREALIVLGEIGVPDTAHGLAERIRALGEKLVQEADKIRQRVQDLHLPFPDTYLRAEEAVRPALNIRDPFACVRQFIEDCEAWRELKAFLDAYGEFVDNERDVAFRTYSELIDYARACPAVFEGEDGARAKQALEEFDTIVETREILPKWKLLQEAALAVIDRYRAVYRKELEDCARAIAELKRDVETSTTFSQLEEPRRRAVLNAYFGPQAPLALAADIKLDTTEDLLRASRRHKVSELAALRKALVGYRREIFERCDREWAEQRAQETGEKARPIYRLDLRARLAGKRFATSAEFEAFWSELGKEIQAKLQEGFEVVIE